MKWRKYGIMLLVFALSRFAAAQSPDTLDIVGETAGMWSYGWNGESYKGGAWCGDTTYKDLTPDTLIKPDTLVSFIFVTITDTINNTTTDTLVPDTQVVFTSIIFDSTTVNTCILSDLSADTGGITPGVTYVNYTYKFRNYYAQVPIIWAGWAGWDSAMVASNKTLMVVYKGLLPTHQMSIEFSYATWRSPSDSAAQATDSIKNKTGAGDGVGILPASPDEWKTAIIAIPDSVNMVRITGIVFGIGNVPNLGGQTSDVGYLKIARISLLANSSAVRHSTAPRMDKTSRFSFIPKSAGKVTFSVYSLRGELLCNKTFGVEANRQYSVRRMVEKYGASGGSQMKLVRIRGAGVNRDVKIW